jgi:hypothetical protein
MESEGADQPMAASSSSDAAPGGMLPALVKRKALFSRDAAPAALVAVGRSLEQGEFFADALAFYERAGQAAEIEALRDRAVELGDLFLYEGACRALDQEPDLQALGRLGERAHALGKLHFARKAFRLAGLQAQADAAERELTALLQATAPPQAPPGASPAPAADDDD